MSTKGYKQKTKLLGIPVVDYGDKILPELEMRRYQIIESMLVAGLRGAVNAVFDEGDMSVRRGENGKYCVILSATGASPSATGTVGGAYFSAPSSVVWENLEDGLSYFLYLRGTSNTFVDAADVRSVASPRRLLDGVSVLMARVDLQGDVPSIDRSPDGKVHARDLARHVMDQENPHGEVVLQDGLLVRKTMAFEKDAVLEFESDGEPVRIPVGVIAAMMASAAGKDHKVVDFYSGGQKGIVLDGKGRVSFVSVSRRSKGTPSESNTPLVIGEVAVGYFGEDVAVDRPDRFVVRNSGDAGVPMRALVVCG